MFLEGLGREARQGGGGAGKGRLEREDVQSFAQAGLEGPEIHPQAVLCTGWRM